MYPWDGKNIYFMGFMATGKSNVGRELSRLLGWPFYDTDTLIEQRAGKSISDIFDTEGEEFFRKLERQVVYEVAQTREQVIALGGGAILDDRNWNIISESGVTICLTASVDLLYKRISKKSHRPLVAGHKNEHNDNLFMIERSIRSKVLMKCRQQH